MYRERERESCIDSRVESLVREQHLPSSRNDWSVYSQRQRKLVKRYLEIRCAKLNLMETKGYGMADIPMLQPCCNPASRTGFLLLPSPPYWRREGPRGPTVRRRAWSVGPSVNRLGFEGEERGPSFSLYLCVRVYVCAKGRKGTPSEVGTRERVKRYCFGREWALGRCLGQHFRGKNRTSVSNGHVHTSPVALPIRCTPYG